MAQTRVPLHVDATLGRNSNPSPSSMDSLDQTSTATSVSGDNNSLLLHHQQQHLLKDHQRPEGDDDDDDDDENEQYVIVRALYPFESKDPTSLSFEKDALIQVLTQLESGWWYGFCNDERGWFPSNYVQEISEDELEQELELAMHRSHPDDTDDARSNDVQSDPEEDEDMDSDDLWLPQTTSDGQVFYYNTRTGESAWTIPAPEGHIGFNYRDSEGFEGEGEGEDEGEGEGDRSIPTGLHVNRHDHDLHTRDDISSRGSTRPNSWQASSIPTRAGSPISHEASVLLKRPSGWASPPRSIEASEALPPLPPISNPFDPQPSWQSLANHMSDTIRNLIHSSEHGYKPYFQPQATQIVQAVRVMLYSSGTVDKDSAPIRMHKELKLYHRQIMAALSKLVLSARMASSTWASEAATTKMQVDANDVAHSVNQFIQTAQAAQVKVHEVDAKIIPNPDLPVADPAKRLSRVLSNSYRASAESAERSQARAVGSAGLFAHLDYYSKSVFKALTLLALQIKTALGPNSTNTSLRAQSASCPILSSAQSSQIVMQCHQTISHLSSLLALVSDFYTIALRDHASISDQFFLDVRSTKQVLYNNVAALVMAIQLATDPMAQATVLEMTLSAAATAEKSCLEMVASTRALASECEIAENILRLGDGISNMQTSDKRTSVSSTHVSPPAPAPAPQQQQHHHQQQQLHQPSPYSGARQKEIDMYFTTDNLSDQDESKVTRNRSNSQLSSFSIGSSHSNTSQPTTPGTEYSGAYPFPNCNYGHGQGGVMVSTQLSSSAASIMSYRTDRPMSPMSDNMNSQLKVLTQRANMETRERDTRREKLRKMLGSDVPMPKPKKKPVENPWYLGHDYSMADISFNMEGHVKGGTLPALVERLTLHDGLDSNFVATFLLTYRSFASTEELFTLLFRRFSVMAPVGLDEYEMEEWTRRKLTPIRLRVMNIIKSWLEAYYLEDEEEDRQILPRIKEFCEANLMHETISFTAVQLMKLVEKRETSDGSFRRMVLNLSTQAPQSITPRNLKRIRFMDLDPLELARQLTILETNIYNRVRPVECLGKAWTSSDPVVAAKAVNIKKIIETSNSYANWINEIVLSEPDIKKRAAILKHLVAVAEKLRQLNNFSTLSTTTAALSLSPIHRLKRTWEIVPSKTMNTLAALGKLTSSARNWADYRVEIHSVNPPCVPFVGVYLTDLVMIEDGNPDILARTENHINFKKRVGVAEVIREIQQYQNVPYCLTVVPEIQAFIRRGLDSAKNVSELYDMSLALEPRIRPVTGIPPPNVPVPQMTAAGPGPSPGNSGTSSSGPGSANASTFSLSSS